MNKTIYEQKSYLALLVYCHRRLNVTHVEFIQNDRTTKLYIIV